MKMNKTVIMNKYIAYVSKENPIKKKILSKTLMKNIRNTIIPTSLSNLKPSEDIEPIFCYNL